jgi:hypothetical protein
VNCPEWSAATGQAAARARCGCGEGQLGNCELQLPKESMETALTSINWNSPEVNEQLNDLAKRRIVQLLEDYRHSGDNGLGIYLDKHDPLPVAEQSRSLLSRVDFPQYLPELNRYLLEYPESRPDGT